jgi:2-hydroxy-6-oxonona-2,4-dienedioate hydrolase
MNLLLKWLKKLCLGLFSLLTILLIVLYYNFNQFRKEVSANLPGSSKVIETVKGPIEYEIKGESEKYVLIIHGTPGGYRALEFPYFIDNDFAQINVSRPGYFRTPLSSGLTPQGQADLYAALLDKLDIKSVSVVGISGGGPSAIEFAIRHPEKCKSLILESALSKRIKKEDESIFEALMWKYEIVMWLALSFELKGIKDPVLKNVIYNLAKKNNFPYASIKKGIKNDDNSFYNLVEAPLEKINVPTLIIHGNKDKNVPYTQAEQSSKEIKNSRLITMEGKNHFALLSERNQIAEWELEFLREVYGVHAQDEKLLVPEE